MKEYHARYGVDLACLQLDIIISRLSTPYLLLRLSLSLSNNLCVSNGRRFW